MIKEFTQIRPLILIVQIEGYLINYSVPKSLCCYNQILNLYNRLITLLLYNPKATYPVFRILFLGCYRYEKVALPALTSLRRYLRVIARVKNVQSGYFIRFVSKL